MAGESAQHSSSPASKTILSFARLAPRKLGLMAVPPGESAGSLGPRATGSLLAIAPAIQDHTGHNSLMVGNVAERYSKRIPPILESILLRPPSRLSRRFQVSAVGRERPNVQQR